MIQDNETIAGVFRRNPRIQCDPECGVVTATDSALFRHFQLLYFSLKHSHNVPTVLFDLGLNADERAWCRGQPGLEVREVKSLIFSRQYCGWQTYSKPLYIQMSPFRYSLWIDCDCAVLRGISCLFQTIKHRPVTTLCYHWPNAPRNDPNLYKILGGEPREQTYINAGVCGFDLERDKALLMEWEWVLRMAAADEEIRKRIVFWDQGALQWVLEKHNLLGGVLLDERWNAPVYFDTDFNGVLDILKYCPHTIAHAAGRGKLTMDGQLVAPHWTQ